MEITHTQRKKGELNLPLIYMVVFGTGLFFLQFLLHYKRLPYIPCVFKTLTGVPCPTCGTTRVLISLSHLDLTAAFRWNPLVFLGGIALAAWITYGFYMLFSKKKIKVILTKKEGIFLRLVLVILFILNWIYLVLIRV